MFRVNALCALKNLDSQRQFTKRQNSTIQISIYWSQGKSFFSAKKFLSSYWQSLRKLSLSTKNWSENFLNDLRSLKNKGQSALDCLQEICLLEIWMGVLWFFFNCVTIIGTFVLNFDFNKRFKNEDNNEKISSRFNYTFFHKIDYMTYGLERDYPPAWMLTWTSWPIFVWVGIKLILLISILWPMVL